MLKKIKDYNKPISILIILLVFLTTVACNSTEQAIKTIDEAKNNQEHRKKVSSWYDEFLQDVNQHEIGNLNQITVKTEYPNTAGFRLLLLSVDLLGNEIQWPKTYVIPFSTDEKGSANIQIHELFPNQKINAIDFQVYHPILFSQGKKIFKLIDDNHYELIQAN